MRPTPTDSIRPKIFQSPAAAAAAASVTAAYDFKNIDSKPKVDLSVEINVIKEEKKTLESTILNFVRLFRKAHEENCKQAELDKKKAQKEAEMEKAKDIVRGAEGFISIGKKQNQIEKRFAEDCCKYGTEKWMELTRQMKVTIFQTFWI